MIERTEQKATATSTPTAPHIAADLSEGATEPDAAAVERFVNMATTNGFLLWSELTERLDPETDLPTLEAIESRLSDLGIPIAREGQIRNVGLVEEDEEGSAIEVVIPSDNFQPEDDLANVNIDDPVRMYLREIGRVKLLTAEQEVMYSSRWSAGSISFGCRLL